MGAISSKLRDAERQSADSLRLRKLKVHKSTQVDTLARQAMKDVAGCDKLGGAANER